MTTESTHQHQKEEASARGKGTHNSNGSPFGSVGSVGRSMYDTLATASPYDALVAKVVMGQIAVPIHPKYVDVTDIRCIVKVTEHCRTCRRTHHRPIVCTMGSTRGALRKEAQGLHDCIFVTATTFVNGDDGIGIDGDIARVHCYVPFPCRIG